jgi:hypothetical protein
MYDPYPCEDENLIWNDEPRLDPDYFDEYLLEEDIFNDNQ